MLLGIAATTALGAPQAGTLRVVATVYPIAYFAERIGGPTVAVQFPIPADVDPPFWEPNIPDIVALQKADLILLNGADLEKWRARATLPQMKLVDTSASFRDRLIVVDKAVTHSHGPGGEHTHSGTAYTTWLDLELAGRQADAAGRAMSRKRPALAATVNANLAALKADLATLDKELKTIAAGKPGLPLLGSHPVYQYLARRYGLNLHSVHWEPNEMPPEAEWAALKQLLTRHAARTMIWEAEPSPAITERLAKLGVRSVVFNPCGNRPATGDFLSVMRTNVENLRTAYH
jgi:zinc transport system substrate-binding protein